MLKADVAQEQNPRAYLAKIFEGAIGRWTDGDFHHEYDESWPHFKERVETALQQLCDELAKPNLVMQLFYLWWCDFGSNW